MSCDNVFETADEDLFHCEDCLKRMHSDLRRFILSRTKKPDPDSESKVKIQIVQPILEKLGWDIRNDSYVAPEYKLKIKGGKNNYKYADYGLLIPKFKKPLRCIIEVKTPGKLSGSSLDDAEHQLLQYAFIASVPLAVLTDGLKWRFYLPSASEDIHVCTLDVKKDPSDKVVSRLVRYLSFENTISNKSTKNAKHDLNERVTKEEITQAWELLASDKLIDILIKETKRISGNTPERRYVEEFLRSLHGDGKEDKGPKPGDKIRRVVEFLTPLIKEGIYTRKQLQEKAEREFKDDVSPKTIDAQLWGSMKSDDKRNGFPWVAEVDSTTKVMRFTKEVPKARDENDKKIRFFLRGKEHTEATAISAYVKIFTILASEDRKFLELLAPQTKKQKNQWLSQNRNDMPKYDRAEEILGGWWLDKNVDNKGKNRRLKEACEVAGIPFGKREGLKVPF